MKFKNVFIGLVTVNLLGSQAFGVELSKELSLNGFVDGQFRWTKEQASPGFLLNDGALYLKYAKPNVEAFLDLPFSSSATSDLNWAKSKAQAFVLVKPTQSLELKAGQFDILLGLEALDSKDLVFTQAASGHYLDTFTHLGGSVTASFDDLSVTAVVSNPNDTGMLNGANATFAVQGNYSMKDTFYIGLGYQGHNQAGPAGMESLYEAKAGVKADILSLDGAFDLVKVGDLDNGYQLLGTAVAQVNEEVSLNLRGNWLKQSLKDDTGAIVYQEVDATGGVQYTPSAFDGLKLKADYTLAVTEATEGADREKEHTIGIAALYSF